MNRHHPYGDSGPRRAGPSGPGPDRYHRFPERGGSTPRRGGGRGRGGPYGSPGYNSNMDYNSYDQGPPRPEMDPMYNSYDDPNQDPYYQGGRYDSGGPPYPPPEYDQGYVKYEGALDQLESCRIRSRNARYLSPMASLET
jgi:transcription initiation factor TFIID subunit 15